MEVFRNPAVRHALLEGVVEPDKVPDRVPKVYGRRRTRVYMVRVSHHGPEARDFAIEYAWAARKAFLSGDLVEAARLLGRCLHYIHDSCVGRGFFVDQHDELEKGADEAERRTLIDEISVDRGVRKVIEDPVELEKFIRGLAVEKKDPQMLLKIAAYATGVVGASVFSSRPCPPRFVEEAKRKKKYRYAAVIVGLIIALIGLADVLFFFAILLAFLVAWGIDSPYRRARKRVEWYGVRV